MLKNGKHGNNLKIVVIKGKCPIALKIKINNIYAIFVSQWLLSAFLYHLIETALFFKNSIEEKIWERPATDIKNTAFPEMGWNQPIGHTGPFFSQIFFEQTMASGHFHGIPR